MDPSPTVANIPIWISIAKVESSFGFDLKKKVFIGFIFKSWTKLTNISDSDKLNLKILKTFEIVQIR